MPEQIDKRVESEQAYNKMPSTAFLDHLIEMARKGFVFDVEDLEMLRDKLVHDGDLTRWILDALELPADDSSNTEAKRAQRRIESALTSWFAPPSSEERAADV